MFTINNFGKNEKVIKNIEPIIETGGTQLRIYDYNTGIYCRILPQVGNKEFALAEAGLSPKGFNNDMYDFSETIGIIDMEEIISRLDGITLTLEEVNELIQNGFLAMLSKKVPMLTSEERFRFGFES